MPTIDHTDAELAALTALIRRAIEEDSSPAPRASTCCAQPWRSSIRRLRRRLGGRRRPKAPSPPHPKTPSTGLLKAVQRHRDP
jgi:hypothetical protein